MPVALCVFPSVHFSSYHGYMETWAREVIPILFIDGSKVFYLHGLYFGGCYPYATHKVPAGPCKCKQKNKLFLVYRE